jgi:hypothetical protein
LWNRLTLEQTRCHRVISPMLSWAIIFLALRCTLDNTITNGHERLFVGSPEFSAETVRFHVLHPHDGVPAIGKPLVNFPEVWNDRAGMGFV